MHKVSLDWPSYLGKGKGRGRGREIFDRSFARQKQFNDLTWHLPMLPSQPLPPPAPPPPPPRRPELNSMWKETTRNGRQRRCKIWIFLSLRSLFLKKWKNKSAIAVFQISGEFRQLCFVLEMCLIWYKKTSKKVIYSTCGQMLHHRVVLSFISCLGNKNKLYKSLRSRHQLDCHSLVRDGFDWYFQVSFIYSKQCSW